MLTIIGEVGVELYETLEYTNVGDEFKMSCVLQELENYCVPRKNTLYETYKFYTRKQHADESKLTDL